MNIETLPLGATPVYDIPAGHTARSILMDGLTVQILELPYPKVMVPLVPGTPEDAEPYLHKLRDSYKRAPEYLRVVYLPPECGGPKVGCIAIGTRP